LKKSDENKTPVNYHLGHRERMREKFDLDNEMTTFRDHELLEFLLNTVIPRKDTNRIAHELIEMSGSLYNVLNEPIHELLKVKNMTVNAAYLLASITPFMRRALRSSNDGSMRKIIAQGDAAEYFSTFFLARNTECLCVLFLNSHYKLVKTEVVDELSPVSVYINIKKIAATAIKLGAVYVMLGHNHPSGSPIPSENDILLVWDLFNALSSLGVTMLDNFIFVKNGFLSFRNVGIISKFIDEFKRNNPNSVLKDDNMQTSLYLSNLKQYLIDVTKLKEENLVELVAVQDFIAKRRAKNDPRLDVNPASDPGELPKIEAAKDEGVSNIKIAPDSTVTDIFGQVKDNFEVEHISKSEGYNPSEPYVVEYDMLFKANEFDVHAEDGASKRSKKKSEITGGGGKSGYMKKDFDKALAGFSSGNVEQIPGSTRAMPIYEDVEFVDSEGDKN